jgi:hypothetical protein
MTIGLPGNFLSRTCSKYAGKSLLAIQSENLGALLIVATG